MLSGNNRKTCLLFDPVCFKGGSKIATDTALSLVNKEKVSFIVLTANMDYWKLSDLAKRPDSRLVSIPTIPHLMSADQGLLFWAKQMYLLTMLVLVRVRYGSMPIALGASGPGIDMALYLYRFLFATRLIQLVHGPVATSRSIGWCLYHADSVHFLDSAKGGIVKALHGYLQTKHNSKSALVLAKDYVQRPQFQPFVNGISRSHWPTRCQTAEPVLYWAASLLKWKGLDTLCKAVILLQKQQAIAANICFIRPKVTHLDVSIAPQNLPHTLWYQEPENLDDIRQRSNIFVSTSVNEPFGLSILEALAAGMCVVIPADGSYWDRHLEDGVQCIKYRPGSSESLRTALQFLLANRTVFERLCHNAMHVAASYQAEDVYSAIVKDIVNQNLSFTEGTTPSQTVCKE